jgi:hypothetical protein
MQQLNSVQLFEPFKVSSGSTKAVKFITKVTIPACFIYALYLNPPEFYYFFDWLFFFIKQSLIYSLIALAAILIPFSFLWAFGLRIFLNIHTAKKVLKKMEPIWTSGFKQHTGVTDRISVEGFFEDNKALVDGIAYKDKVVHLMTRGKVFSIPFSHIRKWEWKIRTPETVEIHGAGLQATAAQASANDSNVNAAVKAFMQSGFFIQVADENNPVLQFHSYDEAVLRKWHEIFTQISEGKI